MKLVQSPRPLSPDAEREQFVKRFLKEIYDEAVTQQQDLEEIEAAQALAKNVTFQRNSSPLDGGMINVSDVDSPMAGTVRGSSGMDTEPAPLPQQRSPQYHDAEQMVAKARAALRTIKYDQKTNPGSTLFDGL